MSTTKATTGVLVSLVAATSFALPTVAAPISSPPAASSTVAISQAAEQQILHRAGLILAKIKGTGGMTTKCEPGSPDFIQTCTKNSCWNDCGPLFARFAPSKAY
jgi:hypothetical protein